MHRLRRLRSPQALVVLLLSVLTTRNGVSSTGTMVVAPLLLVVSAVFFTGLGYAVARVWDAYTWPATPPFAEPQPRRSTRTLREDGEGRVWTDRGGFLLARRAFFVGTGCPPARLDVHSLPRLRRRQRYQPVLVGQTGDRRCWWFADGFHYEDRDLSAADVTTLLHQQVGGVPASRRSGSAPRRRVPVG